MDDNKELAALDLEEQERLKKIEKLDSNQGRKKIIFAGVTVFLIALFAFGTVFGAKYILSYEGTQELPSDDKYASVDLTGAEAADVIKGYPEQVGDHAAVKVDISYGVSIPEEDIKVSAQGVDGEMLFGLIRSGIESRLSEIYSADNREGKYGEEFSEYLPDFVFTAADVKEATLKNNEENAAELQGHIVLEGGKAEEIASKPVYTVFGMENVDEKISAAVEAFSSDAAISGLTVEYDEFDIDATAVYSKPHDDPSGEFAPQLERLSCTRSCTVDFDAEFLGEFAPYGKQHVSFRVNVTGEYVFTHIRFDISKDVYYIEKGDSDEINRKIVSDQGVADIKIDWSSSDPDVLSVDAKGFYKGHKVSDKPVTVTGTYVYNGVECKDTVVFYVRKPVESVKLNESELSLKVGEEASLEAVIKPAEATFKNVYWFTTDENIVTVDENGKVKAVAPGEAGVYVITFDGNFKKTCTVSVTE